MLRCLNACKSLRRLFLETHRDFPVDRPEFVNTPLQHALLQFYRGAKKNANQLRVGELVQIKGRLLTVAKFHYTQGMSRQLGNVQLECTDIRTGNKVNERLRPNDSVETVRLDEENLQYLYEDGGSVHLMNPKTYDQIEVPRDLFGSNADFFADGMEVTLFSYEDKHVSATIPTQVEMKIVETDPHMKGESATNRFKPAVLSNGVTVQVPPFISVNEVIIVNTQERSFVRRAAK